MAVNPTFSIENVNEYTARTIKKGNVEKGVEADWRAAVAANFDLTLEQSEFLRNLPGRSVQVIQAVIALIGREGGAIGLEPTGNPGVANLVASGIPSITISPQWTICSASVHINKCEWFPK